MYDVIIIGAGPAGLTSALYLLRANKKILVLEAKSYGGQILNAHKVENYPAIMSISGYDFATNLYNQVKNLGCEIKYETVINIKENKTVVTKENEYHSSAIIIATGAASRKLNIENEDKFIGKGLSYCATCDGNFYQNKIVAVNGGGSTALEDALYLAGIASKVYLIHRRDEFRGEVKYLEALKKLDNVEFVLNSSIISLTGKEHLEKITVKDNLENIREIIVDGLFVAIGQTPNNEIFKNVVDLDDKGYIIANNDVYTKTPNIYVAGDARVKDLRQLTTAVSDGSIAATEAIKEIKK